MPHLRNTLSAAVRDSVPIKSKILLGVSGGIDSMAMLHSICELREKLKLYVEVAHIDHNLRVNSKNDAEFVEQECHKLNIKYNFLSARKKDKKENTESWGRAVRYKFFNDLLEKRKLEWILTAHHANDLIETFFIKLLSNKELLPIQFIDSERKLIRPFLNITRSTIENYIAVNKIPFVEDETNNDTEFLRNRVRHKLLPYIQEQFGDGIYEVLFKKSDAYFCDSQCLYDIAKKEAESVSAESFGNRQWLQGIKKSIAHLPLQVSWRLVEVTFKDKLRYNLGRSHCLAVLKFLNSNSAKVQIPGYTISRKNGGLVMEKG